VNDGRSVTRGRVAVPPAAQWWIVNCALQTIVRPRTAREVTDLTKQRLNKSVAPTAKYCQLEAGSPNYRRVNQYSTSQNLFTPISSISTLITFSSSAGPPKGSPGIVLAKKRFRSNLIHFNSNHFFNLFRRSVQMKVHTDERTQVHSLSDFPKVTHLQLFGQPQHYLNSIMLPFIYLTMSYLLILLAILVSSLIKICHLHNIA